MVQLPVIEIFGGATSGTKFFLVLLPVLKSFFGATSGYLNNRWCNFLYQKILVQLPVPKNFSATFGSKVLWRNFRNLNFFDANCGAPKVHPMQLK